MISKKKIELNLVLGGFRKNCGRKSEYKLIVIDYDVCEEILIRLFRDVSKWILQDKISVLKARALVFG